MSEKKREVERVAKLLYHAWHLSQFGYEVLSRKDWAITGWHQHFHAMARAVIADRKRPKAKARKSVR